MALKWVRIANLKGPMADGLSEKALAAARAAAQDEISSADILRGGDPRGLLLAESPTYALPDVDRNGGIAGGVQTDGVYNYELPPRIQGYAGMTFQPVSAPGWQSVEVDRDGYIGRGVRDDGTFVDYLATAGASSQSSRVRVACSGDSLTHGGSNGSLWPDRATTSWPAQMASVLPGVAVSNLGASGAPSDEINVRLGAKILYLTGTILSAATAATMTTTQKLSWSPSRPAAIPGALGGVHGTLSGGTGGITFTRDNSGATRQVSNEPFVSDWSIHAADTLIVFMGRNDINPGLTGMYKTVADHVVAATVDAVNFLSPQHKQFILVGTTPEQDDIKGTAAYNQVIEINTRLKALYPANFFDLHRYLVNQGLADMGVTPTPADTAAIANDTLPPSMMDDNTHFNRAAAAVIGKNFFAPILKQKGWV